MWDIWPKMTELLKNTFYDFEYVSFLFRLWKSPLWASVLHFLVKLGEGQTLSENIVDLINPVWLGGWPCRSHASCPLKGLKGCFRGIVTHRLRCLIFYSRGNWLIAKEQC